MSIHEEHGHETPSLEPFYEGLFVLDGTIYAKTGCLYKGQIMTSDNTLPGSIDMLQFSLDAGEPLNKETEIRPLVDLAFANIARAFGLDGVVNPDGTTKTSDAFLSDGLSKLEKMGQVPTISSQIKELLKNNKDLWPEDVLPLIRTFKNVSDQPLLPHKTKGFE